MSQTRTIEAILIAGPTASGKSDFALELARQKNGVVINADSMQVYQDLHILTARPPEEDCADVPHRLYGHVPGHEAYSAARYSDECAEAITAARTEGRLPVIVGGTGLYFRALLSGLSPVPPIPDDIRSYWRSEAITQGADALHEILAHRDAVMAERLDRSDTQRITRALEVVDATGTSLAEWQERPGTPVLNEDQTERIVIAPAREELHDRCHARFDWMMAAGALDEVRALRELQLNPGLPIMRALGVRPLMAHLAGDLSLDEAVAQAKTETRQYIKRQTTWLRGNMSAWKWKQT